MALIEVVLLAGPAFAVGARRQSRSLALMAATGGTPRQARRVVLGSAVVLGGVASLIGVAAGIGFGRALVPVLQAHSSTWFGPVEFPWLHLLGIAGFGLLSAFLAAVVPATIASRQDVVAVLAGRRGDRKPSLRSPILGVVLLGAGVAGAAYGSRVRRRRVLHRRLGSCPCSAWSCWCRWRWSWSPGCPAAAADPRTPRGTRPGTARGPCRRWPRSRRPWPASSRSGSRRRATRSRTRPRTPVAHGLHRGGAGTPGDPEMARRLLEREIPHATLTEVHGLAVPAGGFDGVSVTLPDGGGLLDSYAPRSARTCWCPTAHCRRTARRAGVRTHRRREGGWPPAGSRRSPTCVRGDRVRITARTYDQDGKRVGRAARGLAGARRTAGRGAGRSAGRAVHAGRRAAGAPDRGGRPGRQRHRHHRRGRSSRRWPRRRTTRRSTSSAATSPTTRPGPSGCSSGSAPS